MPPDVDGHDDDLDDGTQRGTPPDRLDRVWVHPAELAPHARRRAKRRPGVAALPIGAAVLGAAATVAVLSLVGAFNRADDETKFATSTPPSTGASVARLAQLLTPSLVVVTVRDANGARRASGVCIRRGSDIVTSASFVGDASTVQVTSADGMTHEGNIVGRDETSGLALVWVDSALPVADLAEVVPSTGDGVWIIGAPTSTSAGPWMSRGVLASTDALVAGDSGLTMGGLLETDATDSPWATGGALVDRSGGVTGIVLGPVEAHDAAYALPIADAMRIAHALRDDGMVEYATLNLMGVDADTGPTVTEVSPGGAAAKAGLHSGDVITSIGGRAVLDMDEVTAVVRSHRPGTTVGVGVRRPDGSIELKVRLATKAPG